MELLSMNFFSELNILLPQSESQFYYKYKLNSIKLRISN